MWLNGEQPLLSVMHGAVEQMMKKLQKLVSRQLLLVRFILYENEFFSNVYELWGRVMRAKPLQSIN